MMNYNEDIVRAFRKIAVTDVQDFIPGKTYYSNYSGEFVLDEIITYGELYKRRNLDLSYVAEYKDQIGWFVYKDKNGKDVEESLQDNNIGASYNPWLIFTSEKAMNLYKERIRI